MGTDRLKIVLVGGGSVSWTPRIGADLLLTPALAHAQYVLLDINQRASDLTKAYLDKLARELQVDATFVSTNRRDALAGAQYVLITIATGGDDAHEYDLSIPERFSIYHTVGDTSGPGGWARLIRNFDVFVSLANDINRYAPGAVVLNYTNPMTALTEVLARVCHGPVVGLCHALFENLELIKKCYALESEARIAVKYAGLNHFFWTTEAKAGSVDVIADLARRLKTRSLAEALQLPPPEAKNVFDSPRRVAEELFRRTGVLPYLGDRHTCEFFPYYITSKSNLSRYGLIRTPNRHRRRRHREEGQKLVAMIQGKIPAEYKQRTRETAADIIAAHCQGQVFIDVGNLPNIGQISNLPHGLVVETAVRVDRNGFSPLAFGALPPIVHGFIEPYAHVFPMVVEACFRRDKKLALQALRLDPVCSHLNGAQVSELGERLLGAHKRFIKAF